MPAVICWLGNGRPKFSRTSRSALFTSAMVPETTTSEPMWARASDALILAGATAGELVAASWAEAFNKERKPTRVENNRVPFIALLIPQLAEIDKLPPCWK